MISGGLMHLIEIPHKLHAYYLHVPQTADSRLRPPMSVIFTMANVMTCRQSTVMIDDYRKMRITNVDGQWWF